ncbi:MAG TPA: hypothetical protein VH593_04195 [Ktedonobacteraceae bacterium]|jgi:hypothetical protein
MKKSEAPRSWRERYRALVSLLFIPLGAIIVVRAALLGWQVWGIILMGLAFIALGCIRLRVYLQQH